MNSVIRPGKNRKVLIPGPCGNIEACISIPDNSIRNTIVVISHPHPLYGGTMQNKVVHTLDRTFYESGMITARFNFRGVGGSDGRYDEGEGETDDLRAVVNWMRSQFPGLELCLAGFSFGAFISLKATAALLPSMLVTVAPPVSIFNFTSIQEPDCDWLLIQGEQDEVVDAGKVLEWARQFSNIDVVGLPGAGHFFHGKLNDLKTIVMNHISSTESGK